MKCEICGAENPLSMNHTSMDTCICIECSREYKSEWQKRAEKAESELSSALAEIEEHHERLRMCHKRTVEADKLWQKAHNQPDVWPDLGELVSWLMNEKKSAEQQAAERGRVMSKEQNKSGHLIDEATKTPRTQAAIKTYGDYIRSEDAVSIEFAEQLETELAEARAEIDRLKEGRDFWRNKCEREESESGAAMIRYVCKEQEKDALIERLKLALKTLRKYPHTYKMTGHGGLVVDKDLEQCDAALLAAERGEHDA